MENISLPHFLGMLFVVLGTAKVFGQLARRIGQPSVLGELFAGVIVGKSVLGLVDPELEVLHLMGELGVIILLFSIGLETDLKKLIEAGPTSTAVAIIGVVLPFCLGYLACLALGLSEMVALVTGAALTATSVGITARVLSDLGRLGDPESQVVIGAAILDDVIGLVILSLISKMAGGEAVSVSGVLKDSALAFGFLIATVLIGKLLIPLLARATASIDLPGTPTILALMIAFGLGWLADRVGSAVIIGVFAAGILLVGSPKYHEVEIGITRLGHFFVPLFFVVVGASVDVSALNPLDADNYKTLLIALVLTIVAVFGKFASGYAPFWFKGNKKIIGAAMIPRGEVGLIFAKMGLNLGVFDKGLFAAVTLVVMITTFVAPPLLNYLVPKRKTSIPEPPTVFEGIEDLATDG